MWVVHHKSFIDDPYVVFQSLDGTLSGREAVAYIDAPCAPSILLTTLGTSIPNLPACPNPGTPTPDALDLNLYYHGTMAGNTTDVPSLNVYLNATTSGSMTGLRLQTVHPNGTIVPLGQNFSIPVSTSTGYGSIGDLMMCSDASNTSCLVPALSEGRQLDVVLSVIMQHHQ